MHRALVRAQTLWASQDRFHTLLRYSMKQQEKADPFCSGSVPLKTTMADQFDEALVEHVCIMDGLRRTVTLLHLFIQTGKHLKMHFMKTLWLALYRLLEDWWLLLVLHVCASCSRRCHLCLRTCVRANTWHLKSLQDGEIVFNVLLSLVHKVIKLGIN